MLYTRSLSASDQKIVDDLRLNGSSKRKGEEELFKQYLYLIREGSGRYGLSEDESFDAYSDTILAAIHDISIGLFKGSSSLKTYLVKIFRNKCVDLLRKKTTIKNSVNRNSPVSELLFEISDNARSVLQMLVDQTDFNLLRQKLNELGDTCHRLLQFWAEGSRDKEIAELMEFKSADVVKTTRLRCLAKLRTLYKTSL